MYKNYFKEADMPLAAVGLSIALILLICSRMADRVDRRNKQRGQALLLSLMIPGVRYKEQDIKAILDQKTGNPDASIVVGATNYHVKDIQTLLRNDRRDNPDVNIFPIIGCWLEGLVAEGSIKSERMGVNEKGDYKHKEYYL